MTATHNFTIRQGADWIVDLEMPYDISTRSYKMEIREERDRDSPLVLDVTPYITTASSNNLVKISVPATETENIIISQGWYDLFETDNDGIVSKILMGCVDNDKQVTYNGQN